MIDWKTIINNGYSDRCFANDKEVMNEALKLLRETRAIYFNVNWTVKKQKISKAADGSCRYNPPSNSQSPGCALGRLDNTAGWVENVHGYIGQNLSIVLKLLPWIEGKNNTFAKDFVVLLQRLHDNAEFGRYRYIVLITFLYRYAKEEFKKQATEYEKSLVDLECVYTF